MPGKANILAGDVGATKSLLAFFALEKGRLRMTAEETFPSSAYPNLEAILEEFLRRHLFSVRRACFGVAGPVSEGRVVLPNLAWENGVDVRALRRLLKTDRVALLNDVEATAYGLRRLAPEQFVVLNPGRPRPQANAALIVAGTGLGEAILFWDGREHRPSASEGSHCDFAPRTALELEFFRYAVNKFGRLSYDRVVSGQGLHLLYRFLRDTGKEAEPAWLAEKLKNHDPGAVISEAALTQRVPLCRKSLDMLVSIYGAEAGNLALKALARAGVYVGGGIAPKILPRLRDGNFMRAFTDKGRLSEVMTGIPVRIVLEPKAALYGAADYAARLRGRKVGAVKMRRTGGKRRSHED